MDTGSELARRSLDALVRLVVAPGVVFDEVAGAAPAAGTLDVVVASAGLLERALVLVVQPNSVSLVATGLASRVVRRLTSECRDTPKPRSTCQSG